MGHPLLELKDKTAVVIGGTSGIGLALTEGLAQAGANVVPTGRRAELVRAAASAVETLGRRSLALTCDVTDNSSLEHLRRPTCHPHFSLATKRRTKHSSLPTTQKLTCTSGRPHLFYFEENRTALGSPSMVGGVLEASIIGKVVQRPQIADHVLRQLGENAPALPLPTQRPWYLPRVRDCSRADKSRA
jgi:short chain dehydrogenase